MTGTKIFLDVYPEDGVPRKARLIVMDPRILQVDSMELFFDVFKKNIKEVRDNYEYETEHHN
jgi:hypothetical protein